MKNKQRMMLIYRATLSLLLLFCIVSVSIAQSLTIHGNVKDALGEPIIGASVLVKGTTNGVITDVNGDFTLSDITKGVEVEISYIGYASQIRRIENADRLNIVLKENSELLEEVVVIGYGTRAKGALTGAITQVGGDVLESKPVTNTMDALQGVIPGVTITRTNGQPGAEGFAMQIRGYSSMNGNKPLVLIDGVPGDMNVLNPNDIADITVLKDASASIYGARAADGVVMVTTKKGKSGKVAVNYSFNIGIKIPHFMKKMANTRQLAEMCDEGLRNIGQPGLSQEVFDKIDAGAAPDPNGGWMKFLENFPAFYGYTDWYDVVYDNSLQQSHSLSFSGGGENNTFLVSAGYEKNDGVISQGKNYSERYNFRINNDFRFLNRVRMEVRTTYDHLNTVEPSMLSSALSYVSRMWSYLPVRNPQGHYYTYQNYQNPLMFLTEGGEAVSKYSKLLLNAKATIDIIDGLRLIGQSSVELAFWRKNANYRKFSQYNWDDGIQSISNDPNSASYENSYSLYNTYTAYFDYNKNFGKHNLNLMIGASHERYDTEYQYSWGKNFLNNNLFTLNLADKTKLEYTNNFGGNASDNALTSFFGRLGYNYDRRFYIDWTMRKDGSSKFAPEKRWSAIYPAVSASWNMSEESFIQDLDIFDILKLRASWGRTGNQELNFGNYDYIPLIYISGNYPLGTPNVGLPGAESSIASVERTWETVENMNVGVDFAFLNSRLSGSVDYFVKKNDDMLVGIELPSSFGGSAPTVNAGKLRTNGWEIALKWADRKGDFDYSISASISDSKNKLIELEAADAYNEGIVWAREGYALNSIFGYQFDGIIQNQQQLDEYKKLEGVPANIGIGDAMYADLDGDGKITAFGNPADGTKGDMKYLGNKLPRYTYSSTINLSYKGFDLSMMWQGVGSRKTIRTGDFAQPYYWVWHQPLEYFYEKNWTEENPTAKYPRIIPGGVGYDNLRDWNGHISENRVDNVAYLRLKNITLGYSLSQLLCKKIGLNSIRFYITGKDLLTFSKGTWNNSFDPEEDRSDWQSEVVYPFNKVISFGIDVKF